VPEASCCLSFWALESRTRVEVLGVSRSGLGAWSGLSEKKNSGLPFGVSLPFVLGRVSIADLTSGVKLGLDNSYESVYTRVMELDFLTTQQIAEAAGVTDGAVRQALLSGRLKGVKVGGRWLVPTKEAERWIALPHRRGRLPKQFTLKLDGE